MAEFETIQERNISGKGVLRVPSEFSKSRLRILYCSVFRKPVNQYLNFNYSPPRSRYGWLTFFRDGYLVGTAALEFPQQSFDGVTDITSQNLIAIKCMYDGLLQSLVNLTNALAATPGGLGLTYISVDDEIADYEYLDLSWDEVRVVCYADTAINVKLVALPHDSCADAKDIPRRPPTPPTPPEEVPPGTPLTNLDPPYEDEENPDNITQPYPGDEVPTLEFPTGEECELYTITLLVFDSDLGDDVEEVYTLFAPIGEPYLFADPGQYGIRINCRGVIQGGTCIAAQDLTFLNSSGDVYSNLRVVSVVPYTP